MTKKMKIFKSFLDQFRWCSDNDIFMNMVLEHPEVIRTYFHGTILLKELPYCKYFETQCSSGVCKEMRQSHQKQKIKTEKDILWRKKRTPLAPVKTFDALFNYYNSRNATFKFDGDYLTFRFREFDGCHQKEERVETYEQA